MTDFNIYKSNNNMNTDLNELVEIGLSPGEMRQALVDRAKSDLNSGHTEFVKNFVKEFSSGFLITLSKESLSKKFENIIYDELEDEFFNNKIFPFILDPVRVMIDE